LSENPSEIIASSDSFLLWYFATVLEPTVVYRHHNVSVLEEMEYSGKIKFGTIVDDGRLAWPLFPEGAPLAEQQQKLDFARLSTSWKHCRHI
jgi:hypothetical protein